MTDAQISRSKLKQQYRYFWTTQWQYKTIEQWTIALDEGAPKSGFFVQHSITSVLKLLKKGLFKMTLEKKITTAEADQIYKLLSSKDSENVILGLTLMNQRNPKKFLKS